MRRRSIAVAEQVERDRLADRVNAYAYGKDFYGVLEEPLVIAPLARTRAIDAGSTTARQNEAADLEAWSPRRLAEVA